MVPSAALLPLPMSSVACLLTSVAASRMAGLAPTWMTGERARAGWRKIDEAPATGEAKREKSAQQQHVSWSRLPLV